MIYAWIVKRLALVVAVVIGVLLIAGLLVARSCAQERTAKTEEGLSQGQAAAATASGVDAVSVVGNRSDADAATDATTRTNDDAIRNAQGADQTVAVPVRDVGLAALCRRTAYAHDARCVRR